MKELCDEQSTNPRTPTTSIAVPSDCQAYQQITNDTAHEPNLEYGKLSLPKVGETPYTHEQNGQTYHEFGD